MTSALSSLLLALGDDELVLGHRHSEWTGHAPHIEEDVAFSSIAQDEIGHAAAYYSLLAAESDRNADALALGRSPDEYRNAIFCERPNGDWAYTLARHWLYDNADDLRLEALEDSAHKDLASLAHKIRREERYHLIHADTWMKRVAQGPVEGRKRLIDGVAEAFVDALGLFEPLEDEDQIVKEGWSPVPTSELRERFVTRAVRYLDELGLPTEIHNHADESAEFVASSSGDLIESEEDVSSRAPQRNGAGGRRGRHTDDFKDLWDTMTSQYRDHPGATW